VSVARVGGKLYAFDDIYEGSPFSGGLLTGTILMSQCDGSKFDLTTGAILRGPATAPLTMYKVRDRSGKIEVEV
jgi:3-phenylpropionate/trans-cinnamate dioxygenase ferredoxin component